MSDSGTPSPSTSEDQLLNSMDLQGVADYIKEGKAKKIVVLAGAGMSVSAGIPDFRSPEVGLYAQIAKLDIEVESPMDVFDIETLEETPELFFSVGNYRFLSVVKLSETDTSVIAPTNFDPTPSHFFVKLLDTKDVLLRHFTQNIDTLDHKAGIEEDKIVEAHGSFKAARCIACDTPYTSEEICDSLERKEVMRCSVCQTGIVKPNVVFFGEDLPRRFYELVPQDLPEADLVFVIGTSLKVSPFNSLPFRATRQCPRVLLNRDPAGAGTRRDVKLASRDDNSIDYMRYLYPSRNQRDVWNPLDCDSAIFKLCELLEWTDDLDKLISDYNTDNESSITTYAKWNEQKDENDELEQALSDAQEKLIASEVEGNIAVVQWADIRKAAVESLSST